MMDYVIVGGGALGLYGAYLLSESDQNSIQLVIGSALSNSRQATSAAGAMHAVFGELEFHDGDDANQLSIERGLYSRSRWLDVIAKYDPGALAARDTILFLKNSFNDFEVNNFETVKKFAREHGCWESIDANRLSQNFSGARIEGDGEAGVLKGEFGFDPRKLKQSLLAILTARKNVNVVIGDAKEVDFGAHKVGVSLENGDHVAGDRLVIASGAQVESLLYSSGIECVPMLKGVGLALGVSGLNVDSQYVLRSVNRGGAQCGFHIVPNGPGQIYVGAGNYIVRPDEQSMAKTATLAYLLDCLKNEGFNDDDIYKTHVKTYLGERPRTIDGKPMLGPIAADSRVYVMSGFNRVALSLAPWICDLMYDYFITGQVDNCQFLPDREPIGSSLDSVANRFLESRRANAIEHGKLLEAQGFSIEQAEKIVIKASEKACRDLCLNKGFILEHDAVSAFIS